MNSHDVKYCRQWFDLCVAAVKSCTVVVLSAARLVKGRQRHSVVVRVVDSRLLFDECEAISEFRRSGVVDGRVLID